ncbi:MAG: TetR/AcrR family transcriptional regulator [Actinomycetota bacterium]
MAPSKADDMAETLLDAAERLYATNGAAGLTTRSIAEAADTTTQSVYTYFGSRDALIEAMYRRAVAAVEEIIALATANVSQDPAPNEVVSSFIAAAVTYREFCKQYPGRFRLIRVSGMDGSAPVEAVELRQKIVDTLVAFGRSGGGWQFPEYEGRVHLTLSAIHGFILAEIERFITPEHDPDRLFRELVTRCLAPYEEVEALLPPG